VPAKLKANATTEIKIRPPIQIGEHLDSLIKTGLYGNSRTEVVMFLVRDQIIHLRKEGQIKREVAKKA
jgi:hypothetical protein